MESKNPHKTTDGRSQDESTGIAPAQNILGELPRMAVALFFAALVIRQYLFVQANAVNVLFWDQWGFYEPLFEGQGWWATFIRQHGPHREGLGLILTRILANLTGWDSHTEAMAAFVLVVLAAVLAVPLAIRFGISRRSLLLAAIPLLFMNVHDYEIYVGAVNLSYAGVPLVLFVSVCLACFARSDTVRLGAMAILGFLLIFTGFGLFVGVLAAPVLALEAWQARRRGDRRRSMLAAAALGGVLLGWGVFAHGYTFSPAVSGFRFPYEHPFEYVVFVGRMLGHFYGTSLYSASELVVGYAVAALLIVICAMNGAKVVMWGVKEEPKSVVLFLLSGFSLLFCADCAIGRVFTGPSAPYGPRYVALLIPAGMALFLQAAALSRQPRFLWAAVLYTVVLIPATAFPRPYEVEGAAWYANGKRAWKAEYLRTHDKDEADKASHFPIFPGDLTEKLKFLQDRELNLFLQEPAP